ncbi:MAG: N-acetyl sugar amidotransferase [Bacteroidota bacterium]|nr:N-acetyl sugar amidotransferase [Bacteroidota bacterium]
MCANCILDTQDDPKISFNDKGVCSYCTSFSEIDKEKKTSNNAIIIKNIIDKIKFEGKNNEYNCLIGISGGVDSPYLAYQAKLLGLKPLMVHYDNGWNSELAVKNIEKVLSNLKLDLKTYVNEWKEFKDIQLSFLKASVIDIELITDQAIIAVLYKTAKKHNIKYILTGHNFDTEAILPRNWYHWKLDVLNIKAIHKKFGSVKIKTYPFISFLERLFIDKYSNIKTIRLLDYLPYNKEEAKKTLIEKFEWQDYGGKHYESIFTRFYQGYILPVKFGVDKRKAHLSTLICSGQISKEEALEEMKKSPYEENMLREDMDFVLKKFNLTETEFNEIMKLPIKAHTDYPSYYNRHYKVMGWFGKIAGV